MKRKITGGITAFLLAASLFCGCAGEGEVEPEIDRSPSAVSEQSVTDIVSEETETEVTTETVSEATEAETPAQTSPEEPIETEDERPARIEITGEDDSFTVMVYLCGTDLETDCAAATADILEMCEAELSDSVNVLIYTGGTKEWQNPYISNETNQIWKVVSQDIECVEEDMGSKPMNDPDTLAEFVSYCGENFPANRNALILWDHGGGALYGYAIDELYGGSPMQINEIDTALDKAGVSFDFIGFDACLMATVETACMIDRHADYMIASEELEPAGGWYYTNWLDAISNDPSMPTEDIGRLIVNDFVQTSVDDDYFAECTLSLIDLTKIGGVLNRLNDFSAKAKNMLDEGEFKTVSRSVGNTRAFGDDTDMIDLMHFARNLDIPESQALIDAVDNAVVYSANSENIDNANGLTVYLPFNDLYSFNSMIDVYADIGLEGEFTDFVLAFANMVAGGQSYTGGNTPIEAIDGDTSFFDEFPDFEEWLEYDWFDEDYVSDYCDYYSEDSFDDGCLDIEDRGDYYALELTDEYLSIINDVRMQLFYDDGEGYIDMGTDDYFETDDDGALKVDFDGLWFCLGDYIVPLYITESTDTYTQGTVSCYLNGELVDLVVMWDDENTGAVIGARRYYDTGVSMKGLLPVNDGDEIQLICDYYTYDGDYDDNYDYGEPFCYDSSMNVTYYPCGEGDFLIYYVFTDIYNNNYYTSPVILTFTEDYFYEHYPEYYE